MRIKAAGYIGSSKHGKRCVRSLRCTHRALSCPFFRRNGRFTSKHQLFMCPCRPNPHKGGKDTTHENSMEIRRRNHIRS